MLSSNTDNLKAMIDLDDNDYFDLDPDLDKIDPRFSPIQKQENNYNSRTKDLKKPKKGSVIEQMDLLKQRREERKIRNLDKKRQCEEETQNRCDAEYERLICKKKISFPVKDVSPHIEIQQEKIFVVVRKRPLFQKEVACGEIDCVSSLNPRIFIHEPKMKIDGITKYIEDHEFSFDNVFGEHENTDLVFQYSIQPSIELVFNRGIVTCFAYGQTGSGKTFTMKGIQHSSIKSLFRNNKEKNLNIFISFYEIYGGRLYDLLNNRAKLQVLEDKNQTVQIFGLEERQVESPEEMEDMINQGNGERTTHNTVVNETSSRSHAICNIVLKEKYNDEFWGKLTLVDLAGSERATETQSNNKSRLTEGAEINKSLLALKECIRALDSRKQGNDNHVPFRNSKLTLVLRDSFVP